MYKWKFTLYPIADDREVRTHITLHGDTVDNIIKKLLDVTELTLSDLYYNYLPDIAIIPDTLRMGESVISGSFELSYKVGRKTYKLNVVANLVAKDIEDFKDRIKEIVGNYTISELSIRYYDNYYERGNEYV